MCDAVIASVCRPSHGTVSSLSGEGKGEGSLCATPSSLVYVYAWVRTSSTIATTQRASVRTCARGSALVWPQSLLVSG